jgi:type I restriction enzyme S subunit
MSKVQFMRLQTSIPSPAEQQKIANFLTVIDQTLTAKEEEIVKVEQWKKGLMQKMFI